jgi:glycosyltransferase 2 family protein
MKRSLTLAGLLVSLACVLFFSHAIAQHWSVLSRVTLTHAVWMSLASALVIYVATYPVVSFAWSRSLKALGQPLRYLTAMRILLLSQFAKYLPGNVGHHVGRVLLAKRAGLPLDAVVGSMLLDMLLVIAAGAACSLPAVQILVEVTSHQAASRFRTLGMVIAATAIIGMVIVLFPAVRRVTARQASHIQRLIRPSKLPLLAAAWAAHCINFLAGGTALFLLCSTFAGSVAAHYWMGVVGVYSAAWLLGFLVPGAPAGLGVREIVLMLGLGPLFGPEPATAAAAALRLITTLGDGLVFVLGFVLPGGRNEGAP